MTLVLVGATGCVWEKPSEKKRALFYPPSPDRPRLQFLTSFSDADPWIERRSAFSDFIVGARTTPQGVIQNPYGVAARNGRIYICDLGAHRVHVIDIPKGSYAVLGTPEQLVNPVNITIDVDGTKYVCDTRRSLVVVYDSDDRVVRTLGDPQRCVPCDLAIRGEELYAADAAGGKVEVWSKDGKLLRVIGSKGPGPDQLRMPTNLDLGPEGHVFVTDTELCTVKEYDAEGRLIKSIGSPGDRPGFLARPKGIAIDPEGRLYVADAQWEKVQIFSAEGRLLLYFGGSSPGPEGMGLPAGISLDETSVEVFGEYVSKDFDPQYLLFVANQFGNNKIGVYAYGDPMDADGYAERANP